MSTYLQLPPQMGGVRFGPFPPGVIYLGSDPQRCQIVLNASQGVFAMHCMVSDAGDGSYTISPVQGNLKVYLVKKGESKAWPVQSAVQAHAGDWVVLASPEGPRFEIQRETATAGAGIRAGRPMGRPGQGFAGPGGASQQGGSAFGGRMANEVQRQMAARMMTQVPAFRAFYMMQHRMKGGAWKSPYFLVSVLMGIMGFIGAGSAGCSGMFYAVYRLFQ
jgi:hypothetical protein